MTGGWQFIQETPEQLPANTRVSERGIHTLRV